MCHRSLRLLSLYLLCIGHVSTLILAAEPTFQREESFQIDPNWQGHRNHLLPATRPVVEQAFGYRNSNFAQGQNAGEIGGRVQRSTTPARYFRKIPPLTLDDNFSVAGRFCVRQADGGSGVMLGWFHDSSKGWRTSNSVALRIDGNGGKYWVFWEYGTKSGKTGGSGAFEGERYQTTSTKPYRADSASHRFQLAYDPRGANGLGAIALTIDEQTFPAVELTEVNRRDGMTLNRFGLWNVEIAGASLEFYVDDLILNGERILFDQDSGWEGSGNQVRFTDRVIRPFHDFGFRAPSVIKKEKEGGELGGIIFRDERPSYYATDVGRLTLDDALHASGKIMMHSAAADSGFCLGWFNAQAKRDHSDPEHQVPSSDLLAGMIEGPSRVGHWFRATYRTSQRQGIVDAGDITGVGDLPILRCDQVIHDWELTYDPTSDQGQGAIEVVFDQHRRRFKLRPGDRKQGAVFDSFGLFNIQSGGHHVDFSIDDLKFTSRK